MRTLSEGLSGLALYDHRRAVHSCLALRGLNPNFSPHRSRLSIDAPVLSGTVGFDGCGRIALLESTVPGSR
jgi:hypothetical protein